MPDGAPESIELSALVVAHNEEANLDACLAGLHFADQIVVVLDTCTDGSKAIAERHASDVIEGSWDIEGERRNRGIEACRGQWILEIDADERVPPDLGLEIRDVVRHASGDWHLIRFDNYIGDHLVRHGWGASFGKATSVALFRKGMKTWLRARVHPPVKLAGEKGQFLNGRIQHYVDDDISGMIQRLDRYTTLRALDLREIGKRESFRRNVRRIGSRFFQCYVRRRGYKEGGYGFLIAVFAGLYPVISYLKAKLDKHTVN